MDWRLALVLWGVLFGAITGFVRWLGAPRWLAFGVPVVPVAMWLGYYVATGALVTGEGGGLPAWFLFCPVLLVAVPVCAAMAIFVPKRNRKVPPKRP
jgi:hypothetical protein